ncbi:hypothetical protein [Tenggerimyces flavus]|uniref:Uncharacterized protein n=1 Tax=Tenggerimyces flavus TaxID=1708749 RepID=A0ABV7Y8N4_9ACTN|nr:hypothetical protein [Tenggerimyces flavus]MBM7785643.1 hypothetical protein [Tenggerimyces flavus]
MTRVARAAERLAIAHQILDDLALLDRWRPHGEVVVCGSVGMELVVRPDIDLEIHSETAGVAEGFAIVSALAELPSLQGMRYRDFRDGREDGLYWKLEYVHADEVWTVDMWLFRGRAAAETRGRQERIKRALTEEHRDTILAIKEAGLAVGIRAHGHWLYRAVLNEGVRTLDEYQTWIGDQDVWERITWEPATPPPPSVP